MSNLMTRRKTRSWGLLALGLAVISTLLAVAPAANAQASRALQSVDFVSLDSEKLLLTLTLSAPAPEPTVFTIDKPARLSLDLPDTRLALAERFRKVGVGRVRAIAAAEAKGRARVVVELSESTPYVVRVDGNKVFVELTAGNSNDTPQPGPSRATAGVSGSGITAVDFRRGEKGEGRIVVSMTDPRSAVDVREESGKVIASFKNTRAIDSLIRRLDVLDFATPVKFIDVTREGVNTLLTVTPVTGADFEQVAYQSGNSFTIELQPLTQDRLEEKRRNEPIYTGERISLSFQSVDIRSLLQIIADVAGTNMVVSDSVNGELAMRLQNVPWDQALDIILRTKGLGMRQEGNVMLVAPLGELAARQKEEAEAEKSKVTLAPLRSEIIQINYAKASEVASLLRAGENSVLSDRGRVTIDDRTNNLLVLETREKLAELRALIAKLDIPVRQVLIESRIVIANDDFSKELGTRFGANAVGRTNGDSPVFFGVGGGNGIGGTASTGTSVGSLAASGFNFALPASGTAGRIGFALLGSDFALDLELSALQTEGRGEIVSTPRVITANAKQAFIEQGREIPYQQAASSGATTVSFKKAVLSLKVTPQITPDEKVIMDLEVNNDSQGQDVNTGNGGTAPSIDTRKVNTQVLVDNGQTVVLGGIYDQSKIDSISKVPLLGDVPVLGRLFRFESTDTSKRELLIFVTPRIIAEGLRVN